MKWFQKLCFQQLKPSLPSLYWAQDNGRSSLIWNPDYGHVISSVIALDGIVCFIPAFPMSWSSLIIPLHLYRNLYPKNKLVFPILSTAAIKLTNRITWRSCENSSGPLGWHYTEIWRLSDQINCTHRTVTVCKSPREVGSLCRTRGPPMACHILVAPSRRMSPSRTSPVAWGNQIVLRAGRTLRVSLILLNRWTTLVKDWPLGNPFVWSPL